MTYGRYENRRGWREMRPQDDNRSQWRDDERGFFERAGDEIASWFGDDDAERRRDRDEMRDDYRRPYASSPSSDYGRFERAPRFRDEGYRRPYTGRFSGRGFYGSDDRDFPREDRMDRGWSQREFTGQASGLHDPHYSEWRRRQIDALDRDYDEFRRENEGRFEDEFSSWREQRAGKRQLLGSVREHMTVVGSDGEHVGTVDKVRNDRIILARSDSEDGRHHHIGCSLVDSIDGDTVRLSTTAAEAKAQFDRNRDSAFFSDERREDGPHILNRSFSGTY